jgi:hypothetical protein
VLAQRRQTPSVALIDRRAIAIAAPAVSRESSHRSHETIRMFKIEVEDGKGLWSDVRGDDGKVLTFESEDVARGALAERFPVLVQMEKYAGGKRTRVIRILEDEDDWPKRT